MSKSASDKEASSNHDKNDNADEKRVTVGDWSEQLSSTGKRYFYNCKTEVSQWEKPKEFIEWEREQKLSGASLTTNKSKAQSNDKNSNAGSIKSNTGKRTAPKRKEIQTESTTVSEELATDSSVEVPKKKIASIPKKGKGKKATEQAISDTLSSPENGRKETGVSDVHEKKSICNPKRGKGKKATSPTKNETQEAEIGEVVDEKKTVQNPKRGKGKKTASSTENQSEETEVGVDNTVNERKSTKQMKGKKTKICKGNSDVHHEEPEVIEEAAIPKVSSSSEERKQNSRSTKARKGSDKMSQEVPKTAAEESAPEAAAVESASETTAVERGSPEASSAAKKRKQSSRSTNTKKKGRKGASGNENYESLPKGL